MGIRVRDDGQIGWDGANVKIEKLYKITKHAIYLRKLIDSDLMETWEGFKSKYYRQNIFFNLKPTLRKPWLDKK